MATTLDLFSYQTPLTRHDHPTIRLLELLPADEHDSTINCNLAEHIFDESCPEYEALSYVWGDTSNLVTIYCNGKAFEVTTSLHDALQALRQRSDVRMLWIDQITINQRDEAEKTHQVSMMRDIYRGSFQTIAWLGKPTSKVEDGLEALRRLGTSMKEYILKQIHSQQSAFDGLPASTMQLYQAIVQNPEKLWGTAGPTQAEMTAIAAVLRRPWFTRMWIVQEAAVCSSLKIQNGNVIISFHLLVLGSIIAAVTTGGRRRNNNISGSGFRNLLTLAYIRAKVFTTSSAELEMNALIVACRAFKATDPRDRFYALYGISSTDVYQLGLRNDYTVAVRQAMVSATFALMRKSGTLEMLELTECSEAVDSELPSWVPSSRSNSDPNLYPWSFAQNLRLFEQMLSMAMTDSLSYIITSDESEVGDQYFDVDREMFAMSVLKEITQDKQTLDHPLPGSPLRFIELENHGVLCLHGQLLDRVEELGPVILLPAALESDYGSIEHPMNQLVAIQDSEEETSDRLRDLPAELGDLFTKLASGTGTIVSDFTKYVDAIVKMDSFVMEKEKKHNHPTGDSIITAYRKVVCAGQLLGMTEDEESKLFSRWRGTIKPAVTIENIKRWLGLRSPAGLFSLSATSLATHASFDPDISVLVKDAMSCLYGRRLAWTANGYLAMVPARACAGDMIFSLQGSSMPFVLRQCSEGFTILGPTYVHGMMERQLADEDAWGTVRLV